MAQRFLLNPAPDEMPRSADVIVIGGGPAGAGAVWGLERAQPGIRIVVIERNAQLAAGTSMASLENYRTAWAATCLARLMERSIHVFHHAEELLGPEANLGLKEQGYLWCGFTERDAARLRAEVDHLNRVGLKHIEFLDVDEVRYRFPYLGERVIAAKHDPRAGWLDSNSLIHALARSAPNATILLGIAETRITTEAGRVTGVVTSNGVISAPKVLIAAGPGARALARTAGYDLPVVVRPRQSFTTPWRHPAFPAEGPMIIGAHPFPHMRPEAREGAIFGWEYHWNTRRLLPDEPVREELIDPIYPVDRWKDPRFPSIVLALMARQFGPEGFGDGRYLRGVDHRAGYYTYRDSTVAYITDPDGQRRTYESQRAIIDAAPGIEGLYLSVAHVGHGIMSAPGAGEIAAARVLGLPLPDPSFADFALDVPFVPFDSGGLSSDTLMIADL